MSDLQLQDRRVTYRHSGSNALARALEYIALWRSQRKTARMARRSLAKLSTRHLKDIGLIESDVEKVLGRSGDVGYDLATRAGMRTGNW